MKFFDFISPELTYKISLYALLRSHELFVVPLEYHVGEANHLLQRGTIVFAGSLGSALVKT